MLSPRSTYVVRETLPLVGGALDQITPVFYRRMFAKHPELERDLFNRGNQAQGDQQRALAGAFIAYATTLVDDSEPDARRLLNRIAHKHASLGVTEEQYPIVHEHLFAAIGEVLGADVVTAEVAEAWDEVYWLMAEDLLAIERGLYAQAGVAPGRVWQPLLVRRRVQESPDTVSFALGRRDGGTLPSARPGQYLSVAVRLADGARQIRQYSLAATPRMTAASTPTDGRATQGLEPSVTAVDAGAGVSEWVIMVKAVPARVEDGEEVPAGEVSTFLHHNVFEGDELSVSLPYGDLVLQPGEGPLLLASAGIGCTPIIAMLHHLVATGDERPVQVLHADQSAARHAHRRELKELVAQLPDGRLSRWYEDLGIRAERHDLRPGYVDVRDVPLPEGVTVYMCGPLPFMDRVRATLLERGVHAGRIHYEVFGPDSWLAAAPVG